MTTSTTIMQARGLSRPATAQERQLRLKATRLDSGLFAAPAPAEELELDVEQGRIEGYLNTWERDAHRSKFLRGAWDRTIRERHLAPMAAGDRSDVNFRFEHGEACGYALDLTPDDRGLRAVFQLVDFKERGSTGYKALVLARERVMKGLSVGFDYIWDRVKWLDDDEMRAEGFDPDDLMTWLFPPHDVEEAGLREGSIVSDPSNAGSRISVVRSLDRLLVPGWRPGGPEEGSQEEAQQEPPPQPEQRVLTITLDVSGFRDLDATGLKERATQALRGAFNGDAAAEGQGHDEQDTLAEEALRLLHQAAP